MEIWRIFNIKDKVKIRKEGLLLACARDCFSLALGTATTAAVEPVAIQPIFIHDITFAICEANIFKGEFLTSNILGFFNRR
jgi:hypothetical protein